MTSIPQTITVDIHLSADTSKPEDFDWWEKDEIPNHKKSGWKRGDHGRAEKAGEGGEKTGVFANLKERGGENSKVKLEEFEIVFGADNRPIAASASPSASPSSSPAPSPPTSPLLSTQRRDLPTSSILGFYMDNVQETDDDSDENDIYDDANNSEGLDEEEEGKRTKEKK